MIKNSKANNKINHSKDFGIVGGVIDSEDPRYNESRQRWNQYASSLQVASSPLHVDIELTNICDIDCIMCERKLMQRPKGMMSMGLFKKIIGECSNIGVDSLKLNLWGESVLHKELIKMIKYTKNNSSLIIQFNTNGNRMTPDISKGLIESGLDKLTISVDGLNEKTYAKIRRGGDFDSMIANIKALLDAKKKRESKLPYVTLQIIRMKENADDVDKFVEYWRDKADYVSVTNIGVATGDKDILRLSLRQNKISRRKPCEQLWQRLSIFWDGTITVCCNDYDGFLKVGNINEDKLLDVWHGAKLNELRNRHKLCDFDGLICQKCLSTVEYEG